MIGHKFAGYFTTICAALFISCSISIAQQPPVPSFCRSDANCNWTGVQNFTISNAVIHADQYATIQLAFAAAPSGGAKIEVPCGTYSLSSVLSLTEDNLWLDGGGRQCTILEVTGATDGIDYTGTGTPAGLKISNLTIRATNASAQKAINISPTGGTNDLLISNVNIDTSGSGKFATGVYFNQVLTSVIVSLRERGVTVGMDLENGSNSDVLIGPDIGGTFTTGIEVNSSQDLDIIGGTVEGNATNALLQIGNLGSVESHGAHYENVASPAQMEIAVQPGAEGFSMSGGSIGNTCSVCLYDVQNPGTNSYLSVHGAFIQANASTALMRIDTAASSPSITGNFIYQASASAPAVLLDGSLSSVIQGNTIFSNGGNLLELGTVLTTQSPVITGNSFYASGIGFDIDMASVGGPAMITSNWTGEPTSKFLTGGTVSNYYALDNRAAGNVAIPDQILGPITSSSFTSTVSTGTAPLTVASQTPVANLVASANAGYTTGGSVGGGFKFVFTFVTLSAGGSATITFTAPYAWFSSSSYQCNGTYSGTGGTTPVSVTDNTATQATVNGAASMGVNVLCEGI